MIDCACPLAMYFEATVTFKGDPYCKVAGVGCAGCEESWGGEVEVVDL